MSKKVKTSNTTVARLAPTEIRYLEGSPKQYRADAKTGTFNINGRTEIGNTFTFHPIAYRYFKDNLFNRGKMEWIELFFIDEKGCLSSIMFNGYSLQNLRNFVGELFYEEVNLTDIVIEVTWEKHKNEAANAVYHIASFKFVEEVSDEMKEAVKEIADSIDIYRKDTITPTCITYENVNYRPSSNRAANRLLSQEQELEDNVETATATVEAV